MGLDPGTLSVKHVTSVRLAGRLAGRGQGAAGRAQIACTSFVGRCAASRKVCGVPCLAGMFFPGYLQGGLVDLCAGRPGRGHGFTAGASWWQAAPELLPRTSCEVLEASEVISMILDSHGGRANDPHVHVLAAWPAAAMAVSQPSQRAGWCSQLPSCSHHSEQVLG